MIKNYIFLGAPGVGKGTVAGEIQKLKGIKHISTGEIFRENIKNETQLGLQVKEIMASGQYVSDDITNALVKDTLSSEEVKKHGFILDGYPRTINQAQFLIDNGFKIDAAVLLDASDETVINRLLARARGKDDTLEVIKVRLEVYNKQTKPLINFYKKENILLTVPAEGNIQENVDEAVKVLF